MVDWIGKYVDCLNQLRACGPVACGIIIRNASYKYHSSWVNGNKTSLVLSAQHGYSGKYLLTTWVRPPPFG